ncbi:ACP S-malonyltransferase [Marinitenerispora sediminis]|uniref:[acyl-carrier-protein] S-malonyltransferase n=1 Tax=Marinitenerispora sediminis TaxID=1931232 RepID=A0A368T9V8_9ACTN|nr:ACP S-malonyltransferase [Marinitenerispora sediminis]RCV54584.1 ACP S-malonyltransferase [Marinitenerispora sediminis]RCV59861.1 ACP S-malonyltransferase [Marinitenerispora sediminis]RCV61188.1 ACP S-malonyltransferase [Marinitenerispora sediminis]
MAERFERWSTVAELDLARCGTTADAEEIRDTAIAQPLLVSAGLAAATALFGGLDAAPAAVDAVAGHSVGEFTAAGVAGVLSPEDALTLVRERGRGMAEAAAATATGMTAVLGGDRDEVLAAIEAAGLTAANDNGSGQIVAAGTTEQLAAFAEAPPARARLRSLSVAGAFHTHHMAPAVERVRAVAERTAAADPRTRLLSNRDGAVVASGREYLDRLVSQISSPVRWDACTRTLADLGVTAVIELPPAGTLVGLAKRALRGVELLAVKTPDDLDRARDLVKEHAGLPPVEPEGAAS